jgi:hypothetical protein
MVTLINTVISMEQWLKPYTNDLEGRDQEDWSSRLALGKKCIRHHPTNEN